MTRVRIVAGPWPERIGCEGTIVEAPAGRRRYPWSGLGEELYCCGHREYDHLTEDGACWKCHCRAYRPKERK